MASETGIDQLDPTLRASILGRLPPGALGRTQVVCRAWRQAAREDAVVRACFARHWGVAGFTGSPRQPSFLHTATLASFVKRHEVERGDSLQALAVRHGVHPAAIKRQNALMSEHSIFSRHFLYIPVVDRAELAGKVVDIVFDPVAKRDMALLPCVPSGGAGGMGLDSCTTSLAVEALRAKMSAILGRSLVIDAETARYYLDEAKGDLKVAMQQYAHDTRWERASGGIMRVSQMQRWIEGRAGV